VIGVGQTPPDQLVEEAKDVEFKQFWELWQILKEKYYEQPVKDKELFYGAMRGLAESVGDPYTVYFEPTSADHFQQALEGKFEGIGAEIGLKDGMLQIIAPLSGAPAERAGLQPGDLILKINAQETDGMSTDQAVTLIRGPKGTTVTLTLFRPKQKKPAPFEVQIKREQIHVDSVKSKMLADQIALIEVNHFNSDTSDAFDKAVNAILKQEAKAIILDLRNNPGGFLDKALNVAGEWMGDRVVVKERRQGKIVGEMMGDGKNRLRGIPTVVLVNQGSASASEIVAGALQDGKQATIVGMKTFGKGSVQDFQNFQDGSGVKITTAEWVTPHERTINKLGLEPDVVVDRTPEEYEAQRDPQLDRAIGTLNGTQSASATSSVSTTTR
jgi:carboxyl-terminal processing protease